MTKIKIALTSAALIAVLASLALMSGVGTADASVKHFRNCKAMHRVYIAGVAKTRRAARRVPDSSLVYVNARLYRANKKLDRDHDGVACELPPGTVIGTS
jgi:hypothetical protein